MIGNGFSLVVASFLFLTVNGQAAQHTIKTTKVQVTLKELQEVELNGAKWIEPKITTTFGTEGVLHEPGMPKLPVVRFMTSSSVTVTSDSKSVASAFAEYDVVPVQNSAAKYRGAVAIYSFNEAAYQKDSFYPAESYAITDAGSVKGVSQKMVTLFPVAYNPVTREFKIRDRFTITETAMPESVKISSDSNDKKIFAIVTGERFRNSPSLKAYAEFKKLQGFEVMGFSTSRAVSDISLRTKVQEVYKTSQGRLAHLLIVGDLIDVPSHRSSHISGVTDHFFASIDTQDYEKDINGPDIGVGRIPVTTEQELQGMVSRMIRYQSGQFQNKDWLKRYSWLATDDRWEIAEGTHNYVIDNYTSKTGILGFFPSLNLPGGDKLYAITHKATGRDVMKMAREGRAIIQYSGHGAKTYWDAPRVTQEDVRSLKHEAMPFVISNACITGDFEESESFAETWIRHPQGAIMFWGSVDSTYWDEDDILEKRQGDAMFKDGMLEFGALTNKSLEGVWQHYGGNERSKYYYETYHVFGDPSISFRIQ